MTKSLTTLLERTLDSLLPRYSIWRALPHQGDALTNFELVYDSHPSHDKSDRARLNYLLRKALDDNHEPHWVNTRTEIIYPLTQREVLVIPRTIEDHKPHDGLMSLLLGYDSATQVTDRTVSNRMILKEIFELGRTHDSFVFGIIDIDDFSEIKTRCGEHNANLILHYFSNYLKGKLRARDEVVQLSNNNFAVLIKNAKDFPSLTRFFQGMMNSVHKKFNIDGEFIEIKFSAGYVLVDHLEVTPSDIYKLANSLMFNVKNSGKNGFIAMTAK